MGDAADAADTRGPEAWPKGRLRGSARLPLCEAACRSPATAPPGPPPQYFFEMLACVLGLTSLPFLLFMLPNVGRLMLRMRPTGYDQSGQLRLALSQRRMKKKFMAEKERAENAHLVLDGDGVISFEERMQALSNDMKKFFAGTGRSTQAGISLQ